MKEMDPDRRLWSANPVAPVGAVPEGNNLAISPSISSRVSTTSPSNRPTIRVRVKPRGGVCISRTREPISRPTAYDTGPPSCPRQIPVPLPFLPSARLKSSCWLSPPPYRLFLTRPSAIYHRYDLPERTKPAPRWPFLSIARRNQQSAAIHHSYIKYWTTQYHKP